MSFLGQQAHIHAHHGRGRGVRAQEGGQGQVPDVPDATQGNIPGCQHSDRRL